MNDFVLAILNDLRAFCSDLLEAGLTRPTTSDTATRIGGSATFSTIVRRIDAIVRSVPDLIESLDAGESQVHHEISVHRTPAQASMPRSPAAWQRAGTRLLPRFWERVTPLLELDPTPLGYVQFVLDRLTDDFDTVRRRLRRHIEEARLARQGTSRFAREDLDELASLDTRLDRAAVQLSRCSQALHAATAGRVATTDRLPHPFPRSAAWTAFRALADSVLRPEQFLANTIGDLLRDAPAMADLSFLYQRWVGARMVCELRDGFGFQVLTDPTGPLFLGGCVRLRRGPTRIELWSEPRLSRRDHPSGLAATGDEVTPDFVLVTPGHGGPDAFVLDATMSHDPTIVERKMRYRERIVFRQVRPQGGVPGRHRPLRAWAATPLAGASHNQLRRPDGSAGVVPMQPDGFLAPPLHSWLRDIVDHADAWQLLAQARNLDAVDENPASFSAPGG